MKKAIQWFLIILAAAVLLLGLLVAVFVGGANRKLLKAEHPLTEAGRAALEASALAVDEFRIPVQVKILGLGEYTHGSHGPQVLRKTFAEKLRAEGNLRAVVLEIPFVDGLRVNRFIHGTSEESLEKIMGDFTYFLYQTEEMKDFFLWLREVNSQGADIDFYGVDIQEWERPQDILNETLAAHGIDLRLEEPDAAALKEARELLTKRVSGDEVIPVALNLRVLEAQLDYRKLTGKKEYQMYTTEAYEFRDKVMAELTLWLQELEGGRILLLGHNGHIRKTPAFARTLGSFLEEAIGEGYYAVATVAGESRFLAVKAGFDGHSGEERQTLKFRLKNKADLGKALGLPDKDYLLPLDPTADDLRSFLDQEHTLLSVGATFGIYQQVIAGAHYEVLNPVEAFDAIFYLREDTPYTFIPEAYFADSRS